MKQSQHFYNLLTDTLRSRFSDDTSLCIQPIYKNNDVILQALIIREPDINIAPSIYLDTFLSRYENGESMEKLCNEICSLYEDTRMEQSMNTHFFCDYSLARERLVIQLINYEGNRIRLQTIPHVRYLDFAITFCYYLDYSDSEMATIQVTNHHLNMWNITVEELKKQALANSPNLLPHNILPITEVMRRLLDSQNCCDDLISELFTEQSVPMYVLTNNKQNYGAACILYPDVLASFARKLDSSFYVLPSSIHEVILLPVERPIEEETLLWMVKSVNTEQLSPTEILSDHIYYYEKESDLLSDHFIV
ncbi:MAG: DUF5688 family protein [bacterium]|nr:DUF5688 family protein [bacterium]